MHTTEEKQVHFEPEEGCAIYQPYYNNPRSTPEPNTTRNRQDKNQQEPNNVDKGDDGNKLEYSVEDNPPWYLCLFLGLQHYLVMFGATVTNPLVIAPVICIGEDDNLAKSQIIGTIFFVSGLTTLLQTVLGVRLPIIQGGTFTFVVPIIVIMSQPAWLCPTHDTDNKPCMQPLPSVTTISESITTGNMSTEESIWKPRMREIQGAIMVASIFQVIIGFSGIVGCVLRFIGPMVIAPTIALAGLSLFGVAIGFARQQWWITMLTIVLIIMFSQYCRNIAIPCLVFKRGKGCFRVNLLIFRMFPVILAIVVTWVICAILTAFNVFPDDPNEWGSAANTNIRLDVLHNAPWFRFPYPGQWGMPTVTLPAVFGMLAGVLASMVESIGDYYACARMAQVPPPPMHAVNRGIGMEGLGCILAGAWGTGSGTTSYSENIGAIGITKVASRRVIQIGALIMLTFGVFGKCGALFVTIPDPIVGGVFIVMFGMITAVGISNLQFVDLNSSRNLFIIGFSLFFGLTLPNYLLKTPGAIQTGNESVNQILTVLLSTSMFVGGLAGFVLDNTIPGTDEERGIAKWRQQLLAHDHTKRGDTDDNYTEKEDTIYEIPSWTKFLRRWKWTRYMPFLPTFDESLFQMQCRLCKRREKRDVEENVDLNDPRPGKDGKTH